MDIQAAKEFLERQSVDDLRGSILTIYVNEVIRPNRKFFGRTKHFYSDTVIIDNYSSIDEAVKSAIAEGLEIEAYNKQVNGRNGMKKTN